MGDSISVITTKACSKCKQVKNLSMFHKKKNTPSGYQHSCKSCSRNASSEHYERNREKILCRASNYRKAKYQRERCSEGYALGSLLKGAKDRAKAKELPFDLTIQWLKTMIVFRCPITLQPIDWLKEQVVDGKAGPNSPSIDRIIPELGYVQSNCAIISHRGNTIKHNGTIDEHRRVVQYMAAQQLRDTEF